ncbi:MAG: PSD1 and planctomycete cytochrome C domain-containing protein [Planctomycetota bacterium]|nr:PSD1 and planctomycete cytochrome C domain-containing protein [Planctomycetota bacterium]
MPPTSRVVTLPAVCLFLFQAIFFPPSVWLSAQDSIEYNRDILPILSNNCFQCHGFDANTREANLRLDSFEKATAELESGNGQAIVPQNHLQSELWKRIQSDDDAEQMPPPESGKSLSADQKRTLKRWIQSGAPYERHWAFLAPKRPELPNVKNSEWPENPIDYFALARLEKENLSPSPRASRRTLIRRVALDVTGLPPTPEEIHQFLGGDSDDSYEKMVDHFLNSDAYGEQMARRWLDLARYADSSGYQYDRERSMWVWRDWVINAFNTNMPYDQFTIEQLAGDLIPEATPQQILATGFNRNHPITIEGGVIDEEYRTEYVLDRLNTTATVWMGMTLGCARCHDHKFDPITQVEFYQMSDFFNQVAERGLNGFEPMQQIASPLAGKLHPKIRQRLEKLEQEIAKLKSKPTQDEIQRAANEMSAAKETGWKALKPENLVSSGGSELVLQKDLSVLAGGANPQKDNYRITATTSEVGITAIRLECLTDPSLPGGGPGRHSNSNFVLTEFELTVASVKNPRTKETIRFQKAIADYSQQNYEIAKAIDGSPAGNSGWAVDGPTRKKPATAIFFAEKPFGYDGGTELQFLLRHEAGFATHGVGRPRLSLTVDTPSRIRFKGLPSGVLEAAKKGMERWTLKDRQIFGSYLETQRSAEIALLNARADQLRPTRQFPRTMVMKELGKKRQTHVLKRGQYNLKEELVSAEVPGVFPPMKKGLPKNRLGLARWLVDPQHPLTARVAVNRYWQMFFGTGLVKSMEDFGTQGDWPSHPEILDWLAVEFRSNNWDVKKIQKTILMSATYRQSSKADSSLRERDPENLLLARGPRFRLDAEQIRDQALAVSGLLNPKIGGASVYPYQPEGLWLELNNRPGYSRKYVPGKGDTLYRRSLYTFWKRTVLSPMMKTFDAPEREFCTVNRSRTNTPLQALLLLQGPQFVEAARKLAERILMDGGLTRESRIRYGFELVTSRQPTDEEAEILSRFQAQQAMHFKDHPQAAEKILSVGASRRNLELNPIELAAWTEWARLLLNLDETINRD